jgi:hypothetical protein
VVRSDQVFASWDGVDTLTISDPAGFDPDDCMAQMIFHELCHALVEAPVGMTQPDWGLENIDDSDLVREHACHRLQAALTGPWGLRTVLAPTTCHRSYYQGLPDHPLMPGDDPAIQVAQEAYKRATVGPWAAVMQDALRATAALAGVLAPFGDASIWSSAEPVHPAGMAQGAGVCGACVWRLDGVCSRTQVPVAETQAACVFQETDLGDCQDCGACCHRGFDVVEVQPDEALASRADWVVRDSWGLHLPRPGGECVALVPGGPPWRCAAYDQRPQSCRDLARGSEGCLAARERVGLTAPALTRPIIRPEATEAR